MNELNQTGRLLAAIIDRERIKTRLIDLVAYSADAGFYTLRPKAVVQPVSEDEIIALFAFSAKHRIPLTFRTAGTSLSGQSVTDGILVDLSQFWDKISVEGEGQYVRVQPGVIGAMVNARLKKFRRKIGPDPASINSAMMGGILSNNASGMCCGVRHNSYHTTKHIRFILPDGKTFSTERDSDYSRFHEQCPDIVEVLLSVKQQLKEDVLLASRIREKYAIKNTVGYSVNAFLDYEEPLDILAHLLIGAEGTLGFIAEAVLHTITDYPVKATGLLYFPDIFSAAAAISAMVDAGAEAAELMDRASLRSVESAPGTPDEVKTLPPDAAAILLEFQGNSKEEVENKVSAFLSFRPSLQLLAEPQFSFDPARQAVFWKIRKGLFPSVGALRSSGSTVILEDIAVPIPKLGAAIMDLHELFKKFGYDDAIIFGHAKDGNLHFVVTQRFDTEDEINRYDRFIREVVELVTKQYNGSLKAEHGTGRNMAPFVETEWGPEIYSVMSRIKSVVDPLNLVNPGVIINSDHNAHIKDLKELPRVEEEVDKCMECGFCEHKCPSRDLTLTPRTRIIVRRELYRLDQSGKKREYRELLGQYQYDGLETCAVDGMCATVCPVDINTGSLVKRLRRENHSKLSNSLASFIARNFRASESLVRFLLRSGKAINNITGPKTMFKLTSGIKRIIPSFPLWTAQISPSPSVESVRRKSGIPEGGEKVIYFPTCLSRMMGGGSGSVNSQMELFLRVSRKAGINLVIPDDISGSCCGQAFSSKGYYPAYTYKTNEVVDRLWKWTEGGKWPVVMDTSSCTHAMMENQPVLNDENRERSRHLKILDTPEFLKEFILPHLKIEKKAEHIILHPVCSLHKMKTDQQLADIANMLSDKVTVPVSSGCCGMAGDRGFLFPELPASAIHKEALEVKQETSCTGYFSTSRPCEMALSEVTGKQYASIVYLVDELSRESGVRSRESVVGSQ